MNATIKAALMVLGLVFTLFLVVGFYTVIIKGNEAQNLINECEQDLIRSHECKIIAIAKELTE